MSVSKVSSPSSDDDAGLGIVVANFYRFVTIDDAAILRRELLAWCQSRGVRGTVLLAREGLNATVAGARAAITDLLAELARDVRFAGLQARLTPAHEMPFRRLKIKLKSELVSFGRPGVAPAQRAGTHVPPSAWNALINDPAILVLDARNAYEFRLGSFARAEDCGTRTFKEFPAFVERALDPARTPKIAMFCTGGIRCEKASAYLLARGFSEVYQLEGGVLRYLEEVPAAQSRWQGECFVFDQRVALDDTGEAGNHVPCHGCRQPLGEAELASPHYEEGVSCPYCYSTLTETQRAGFRERRRQVALADARQQTHIGAVMEAN